MWQYTAMVEEHNDRVEDQDEHVQPWTKEEYQRDLEMLRNRGDPSIQV